MYRKVFFLSLCAGIFSAVACIVYQRVYFFALEAEYSKLVNIGSLMGMCVLGCMVAGIGFFLLRKYLPKNGEAIFNLGFVLLSFGTIIFPFAISLPLDIKAPELFPGLTVPMHFFPAMGWFALRNLFIKEKGNI